MSRHVKVFQFDVNSVSIICEKFQGVLNENLEAKVIKHEVQSCATFTAWVSKVGQSAQNGSQSALRSEQELHARAKMCWARAQEAAVQAMRAEECAQRTKPAKQADKRLVKESEKNECTAISTMQSQVCAKVSTVQNADKEHTKEVGEKFVPQKLLKDKLCEALSHLQRLSKFCVSGFAAKYNLSTF